MMTAKNDACINRCETYSICPQTVAYIMSTMSTVNLKHCSGFGCTHSMVFPANK